MKICIYNSDLVFEALEGETILSAFGKNGFSIAAPCGGRHICGKCKVRIISGSVLGDVPDMEGLVLACQAVPETDLTIALLHEANTYDGGAYQDLASNPSTTETVSIKRAGVALDIGTTTVSARLVDLDTGSELDTYSALNAQKVFGADVMSRIGAARSGKTAELFNVINRQTQEILSGFISKFSLPKIETLTVAANTTMLHLFANTDPSSMGEVPFTPVFLEEKIYAGKDLALSADKVILLPSISSFIGGDIVSGLGEIDILKAQETTFFIDIGTNGEMALFHQGKIYCASAAAGPALEGAEISCGTGSIRGAINKVEWTEGKLSFTTIGGAAPVGLCGCGLIDAMALMLDREIIDETGAFSDDDREEFQIAGSIALVNRDVRQYQLAKSAILSAIKILFNHAGLELSEIKNVFVAGGLGFYIDQKTAVRTGLLPDEFLNHITVSGNTSLRGAVKALLDPRFMDYCQKIIAISSTLDLASDPAFMDAFAENMLFPM
ncbi:ASKHA domain-containing protein [Leadbettera azotonutricia]|uniref:Ferredoxin n=1 Tax=Leadbettera azotonutricia (strain ATCC BAA-888 / DSM 13862 / ZAS-9) TaxID=545695 RepID=F5YD82_LEAAZ|nr:ASKHA domain-containing protein [Leadbettera azotonutricia]AEF82476.1 ferredoxin [Leadbettera azotonutricia ZAS-9]